MLTRFVRIQLIVFSIASAVGLVSMAIFYMQLPTLAGVGRITVRLELPNTGGLYQFGNVTYRGVEVGKVTAVELTSTGATATLNLRNSPEIPSDLTAEVRSVSAVGEQYVDLRPRTDAGPFLRDGSVIPMNRATIPQPVGPMLDKVSSLVGSIPTKSLGNLLDETYKGLNGADYDFGSLLDSTSTVARGAQSASEQARELVDDAVPLVESQAVSGDAIRTWARSLAGVTEQLKDDDPQLRRLLQQGPPFAQEVSGFLNQLKPALPLLLSNLTTIGKVAVTYNKSLEQILVLLPPFVEFTQGIGPGNNSTATPNGDFTLTVSDPPPCTVGFLPPSSWRSPSDLSVIDTPEGLYCKLPQDSPVAVRGARNYPCIEHPGKRAPTVEICNSDQDYQPLAQRQHVLGPYPIDPNLIAQGIPPDSRVNPDSKIYGPIEGTPLPPGVDSMPPGPPSPLEAPITSAAVPPPEGNSLNGVPIPPADPAEDSGPVGAEAPVPGSQPAMVPGSVATTVPAPDSSNPPAMTPSSFEAGPSITPKMTEHSVAFARYDPRNGSYVGSDGMRYQQSDVVAHASSWQDLMAK